MISSSKCLPILAAVGLVPVLLSAVDEEISFNRDIRPILSDKCFACHGPDPNTREADLRLDMRDDALAMEAIVPGDLKASELYWRITSDDEIEIMPPPETHKQLTESERELLTRWIEKGAEYEAHWAYLPVERPDETKGLAGPAAVDHLVREPLAAEALKMASPADEITLLRRLHFDITGLPPAPEDLPAFRMIGREAYVDRLLASPHFGERMAIEWLDAVRYADTVGYHGDQEIEVSAFRDWVIDAFNRNQPFDRFTIEQIAGDLLPDATLDQKVAASYHRLGQSSQEGGIQDAEYLAKYQAERVRTTATAWLGATLACAECHDHKFDPYTTRDFYEFAAFFADILEKGAWTGDGSYQEDIEPYQEAGIAFGKRGPQLAVPTEQDLENIERIESQLAEAKRERDRPDPALARAARKWAAKTRQALAEDRPADYVYLEERGEKNEVDTKGWNFVNAKKGQVHRGGVARVQESAELIQHIGRAGKKPIEVSDGDVLFAYVWLDPKNPPRQLMLQFHHHEGGWSHRAWWGEDVIPYGKGSNGPAHRRLGELPAAGEWVRLEVPVAEIGLGPGDRITELAYTQFGGRIYWDTVGLRSTNDRYQWADVPEPIRGIVAKPEARWSETEKDRLLSHYRTIAPEREAIRARIAGLESQLRDARAGIRTIPATVAAKPREIRILPRGNWTDRSGELVTAKTPHFLPAVGGEKGEGTRLELARWLVSPENPLTARTFVNRLWARLFGNGISGNLEDLGSQGQWPTHPGLLDWLAAEFVESGWDVKHLVRTVVLSEAYAQSSDPAPELLEIDPYNRLLARQSAIRLPAELVRDNALSVSGLLNPEIGGRSVRPYQPAGYYQHLNFPRRTYQADRDENQYRRAVYTHWQRTFLHPAMKAFDAPSREECTMGRESSSTPLQALVLLNDPSFVEAAKVLAARSEDLVDLFERVLTRAPTAEELRVLEKLEASERKRLASDSAAAEKLLGVGLETVEAEDPVALAARTAVARTVLNLHETIIRY
ncbi:MAG: PSD1 and planctomycete cytochrome C domain-containing protein [Verrucomicrobiales bacterium]